MAEKIISPGVFTNEIDASFLPAAIADLGAVVIGPTVKGPVLTPTVISSFSEYQAMFGTTFKSSSATKTGDFYYQYLTSHLAEQYLQHNNTLTVVRILAGSYGNATGSVSSSADHGVLGGVPTYGKGAIGFASANSGSLEHHASMSIHYKHPDSSSAGKVNFVFSSGSDDPDNINSSSIGTGTPYSFEKWIYVHTGSVATNLIEIQLANAVNDSSSFHSLPISASYSGSVEPGAEGETQVLFTSHVVGDWDVGDELFGKPLTGSTVGGSTLSASLLQFYTSSVKFSMTGSAIDIAAQTGSMTGNQIGVTAAGTNPHVGVRLSGSYPSEHSVTEVFKLHTLADGVIVNSSGNDYTGSNNILVNGTRDNLRWNISSVNYKKGTFSLNIRQGVH